MDLNLNPYLLHYVLLRILMITFRLNFLDYYLNPDVLHYVPA